MAYNREKIGDSQAIIDRLEKEAAAGSHRALDRDQLSAAQQDASQEVLDLVENKLYFSLLYSRFVMDEGWEHQIEEVKFGLPFFLWCCLPRRIRAEQIKKCAVHGCTNEDVAFMDVRAWLQRVTEVLGDTPFLFGDEPRVADCSLFGFLVLAKGDRHENPITTAIRENGQLVNFVARMTSLLKK